jgi:3D (Asp-Asp-Asp) domain-containing protein
VKARNAFAALVTLVVIGLAACAGPTPATAEAAPALTPTVATPTTAAPQAIRQQVEVTFYAAADNDPPGSAEIAYPNSRHTAAGGTGTYADPLSLAADPRAIQVGTRVYYPQLRKYFVMEDDCAQCITDWRSSRTPHIDLWTGDYQGSALLACENALTPDGRVAVEVNPPPGRPVDPRPLFNGRGCTT